MYFMNTTYVIRLNNSTNKTLKPIDLERPVKRRAVYSANIARQ